jgi:predicted RNase H-like HicB family nuclease
MDIEYHVQIWKEGDQFIANAMPLDIASSGSSPEEARQALDEAVRVFLRTATDHGTLDEVLEDSGYKREAGQWHSPPWVALERHLATVGP